MMSDPTNANATTADGDRRTDASSSLMTPSSLRKTYRCGSYGDHFYPLSLA